MLKAPLLFSNSAFDYLATIGIAIKTFIDVTSYAMILIYDDLYIKKKENGCIMVFLIYND